MDYVKVTYKDKQPVVVPAVTQAFHQARGATIEDATDVEIAEYEGKGATAASAASKGKGATAEEKKIKVLETANANLAAENAKVTADCNAKSEEFEVLKAEYKGLLSVNGELNARIAAFENATKK